MPLSRNSGCKDTAFLLIDKYFAVFLRISLRISEQDGEQCTGSHRERVIKIADDADRGDIGKSCRNQHLCSVWDNSLYQARERIEDAGSFSPVEMEFQCDVMGYWSGGDDGDGIVGRT